MRPRVPTLAVISLLVLIAAACSETDGRALPPAASGPSSTTSSVPSIEPPTGDPGVFTLRSIGFVDGGPMPEELTCTGASVSPALSWTGTPADAASLALVVRDRNAGDFVHWVVTGIDPFVQGIGEGGVPENAVEGPNSAGTIGWLGPCPPAGSGTHTYEVALLALPGPVGLGEGVTAEELASLLDAATMERAVLTGTVTAGGETTGSATAESQTITG